VDVVADLPTDAQPAEVVQQGQGLLDHPPVTAQAGAVRRTAAGDHRGDAPGADPSAVEVVILAAVGVDLLRTAMGSAAAASYRRDGLDQGQQLRDVACGCRR
jgi:hypothetical protein